MRFSINQRIIFGILILILIYGISGFISVRSLIKSKEITTRNSQIIQPSIILLNELELMIVSSKNYSSSWITFDIKEHPDKKKLLEIHETLYPKLKTELTEIGKKWSDNNNQLKLQALLNCFDTVIIYQNKIIQSLNNMQAYQDFLLRVEVEDNYLENINLKTKNSLDITHELIANLKQQSKDEEKFVVSSFSSIKTTNILLTGLSVLISLVVAYSIYRLLKVEEQKNKIAEERNLSQLQKAILAEKNKEITDSINYAKRIQQSILPSTERIKNHFKNHFIFYEPRDIVSGDFYWFKEIDANTAIIAAADCTGHGVPGAFVSFVCNSSLNNVITDYKISNPGEILDKTSVLVKNAFEQYGENDVKDGMDIALCSFTKTESGAQIKYAGAHNSLCVVKNNQLEILKANRQPIGASGIKENFTTQTLDLNKGDSVYLFTDGFMDQFGGENSKKYKSTNFYSFLHKISSEDINEQKKLLKEEFGRWMGSHFQVDDVLVIGIKV
ncbi:MAG: PP2C family protein-serine/threonine phosphatase [Bacteroidia bacterium]